VKELVLESMQHWFIRMFRCAQHDTTAWHHKHALAKHSTKAKSVCPPEHSEGSGLKKAQSIDFQIFRSAQYNLSRTLVGNKTA
jgi:hypothetical protein